MFTVEKPRLSLYFFMLVGLSLVGAAFLRDYLLTRKKIEKLKEDVENLENPVNAEPRIIVDDGEKPSSEEVTE